MEKLAWLHLRLAAVTPWKNNYNQQSAHIIYAVRSCAASPSRRSDDGHLCRSPFNRHLSMVVPPRSPRSAVQPYSSSWYLAYLNISVDACWMDFFFYSRNCITLNIKSSRPADGLCCSAVSIRWFSSRAFCFLLSQLHLCPILAVELSCSWLDPSWTMCMVRTKVFNNAGLSIQSVQLRQ